MNREEVEKALRERLGITPEQVRERFLNMQPLNVGAFTKEVRGSGLHGDAKRIGA